MEELRREAEKLAEERRIAREQAMEWTREVNMESDEERERRQKKPKKVKHEAPSGDESEPKKKRRGKLRRAGSDQDEEQPVFSDEEELEKPAKKVNIYLDLAHNSNSLNILLTPFSGPSRSELSGMTMKRMRTWSRTVLRG